MAREEASGVFHPVGALDHGLSKVPEHGEGRAKGSEQHAVPQFQGTLRLDERRIEDELVEKQANYSESQPTQEALPGFLRRDGRQQLSLAVLKAYSWHLLHMMKLMHCH